MPGSSSGSSSGSGSPPPDGPPWLFRTEAYKVGAGWIDSEDLLAALSLPIFRELVGEDPTAQEAVLGFVNSILSRNLLRRISMLENNVAALCAARALVAGLVLPFEQVLLQSERVDFLRTWGEGTIAQLLATLVGSKVSEKLPDYT